MCCECCDNARTCVCVPQRKQNLTDVVQPAQVMVKLREMFPRIPQKVAMIFASFADSDNNGIITNDEFTALIASFADVKEPDDMARVIFNALDVRKRGHLWCRELRTMQRKLGIYRLRLRNHCAMPLNYEAFKGFFKPYITDVLRLDDPWVNHLRDGRDFVYPLFARLPTELLDSRQPTVETFTEGYNEEASAGL